MRGTRPDAETFNKLLLIKRTSELRATYRLQLGPEQLKAWSQNLGHANVLTTMQGYGHVSPERQGEILGRLPKFGLMHDDHERPSEVADRLAEMLKRRG